MEEQKISKFNASQLKILNLNNIWVDSRRYREAGNLQKVKWCLHSAEIELNVDIVKFKYDKQLEKINDKIEKSIGKDLYIALLDKEKLLRAIEDKSGKGISYSDPGEDEMD